MGVSLGGIIITPLATYLVDEQGWRAAWIWLGVLSFLLHGPRDLGNAQSTEDYGLYPDGLSADAYQSDQGGERVTKRSRRTPGQNAARSVFMPFSTVIAFGFFTINIVVLLLHTIPYLTAQRDWPPPGGCVRHGDLPPSLRCYRKPFWGHSLIVWR